MIATRTRRLQTREECEHIDVVYYLISCEHTRLTGEAFLVNMTGKRLLDAASLFNASRAVASKHIALRTGQFDLYKRTSSLAKAVKNQTDRVTLTFRAAAALAERFDGPSSSYSTQASSSTPTPANSQGAPVPSNESVEAAGNGAKRKEGLEQDHFYEKSKRTATAEPVATGELGVRQEKADRYPLPDGTIPPAGSDIGVSKRDKDIHNEEQPPAPSKEPLKEEKKVSAKDLQPRSSGRTSIPEPARSSSPLSADKAKKLQRQAESQIPSRSAEPPSKSSSGDVAELGLGQDKDVFYQPSTTSSPVLSALPRVKVPKVTEDTQGSDEHVQDAGIDQDVFYSASRSQEQAVPSAQAIPEQNQPSAEMFSDLFHSPKVARMLRGKGANGESTTGLKMQAAKDTPIEHSNLTQGNDQDTFNVRTSDQNVPEAAEQPGSESLSRTQAGHEEMRKLAADMASDVEKTSSRKPQVRTYLRHLGVSLIRADRRRTGFSGNRIEPGTCHLPDA